MKNCMCMPRPKSPAELVLDTTAHLNCLEHLPISDHLQIKKKTELIGNHIVQLKTIMLGTTERLPLPEQCTELAREFFKGDALRLLIHWLPTLSQETRTHSIPLVARLIQHQPNVRSRPISCDYLKSNLDLIDTLLTAYSKSQNAEVALHYGAILRECIRVHVVAEHVLDSTETMKRFSDYVHLPNYEIAADASQTFRLLLMRHKSTTATFLSENYEWFFEDYNVRLLGSTNNVTKCGALGLLAEILAEETNFRVMRRYVGSMENLELIMNLLKEPVKKTQMNAFKVFRLFVVAQEKPSCIVDVLRANKATITQLVGAVESQHCNYPDEKLRLHLHKDQVVYEINNLG